MTLPASLPLSLSQVATELGLSLPLSVNHAWVLALANKAGLPLSFSDLLGKTGRYDGSLFGYDLGGSPDVSEIRFANAPFFGGTLDVLDYWFNFVWTIQLHFNTVPNWTGNILIKNNTTGFSIVATQMASPNQNFWKATFSGGGALLIRNGFTDSFTILPSN